jgi:hypothetical protein
VPTSGAGQQSSNKRIHRPFSGWNSIAAYIPVGLVINRTKGAVTRQPRPTAWGLGQTIIFFALKAAALPQPSPPHG